MTDDTTDAELAEIIERWVRECQETPDNDEWPARSPHAGPGGLRCVELSERGAA